jgi:tetratricopeptide (TPR) repeat protein
MKTGAIATRRHGEGVAPTSHFLPFTSCFHWGRRLGAVVLLGAATLGCAWIKGAGTIPRITGPDVVFPRLDSAREQFFYARQVDERTLVGRKTEERDVRLTQVIAAYQMVLDHFPDDQLYAPLALASIGNCYYRLRDYRGTIRIFKNIQERYPCYPFVHAEAEWMIGRSLDTLGDSREAKRHYKLCIDTFGHSRNEAIKALVALCKQRYIEPSVPGRRAKR